MSLRCQNVNIIEDIMLLNLCNLVLLLLVQLCENSNTNEYLLDIPTYSSPLLKHNLNEVKHRHRQEEEADTANEAKFFDSIREFQESKVTNKRLETTTLHKTDTLNEIKLLLLKMLCKLDSLECGGQKDDRDTSGNYPSLSDQDLINVYSPTKKKIEARTQRSENNGSVKQPRWGEWTPWSTCSVTCGKGRQIRWRHCIKQCDIAETEMEEKTCQLPACAPKHLFGISFK